METRKLGRFDVASAASETIQQDAVSFSNLLSEHKS